MRSSMGVWEEGSEFLVTSVLAVVREIAPFKMMMVMQEDWEDIRFLQLVRRPNAMVYLLSKDSRAGTVREDENTGQSWR